MATALCEEPSMDLMCSLCKHEFTKPKLLPCQHSFCIQCLHKFFEGVDKGQPICCPACKVNIDINDREVESLPDNYLFNIVKEVDLSTSSSNLKCISCDKGKKITNATHKCLDCGDTLCQLCNEWHCRFTATEHHVVISFKELQLGQFQKEFNARKVVYCELHSLKDHKIPLSTYCDVCKCLVCVECIEGGHKGHTVSKIKLAREKHKSSSNEKLADLQKTRKVQDQRMANIERCINETKTEMNKHETIIYDTATELYALIDKIKDEKLTELKSHYEKELEHLNSLLEMERNKQRSLQATIAFTKMFLEKSSDADFLRHDNDVKTRMESSQTGLSLGFKRHMAIIEKEEKEYVVQKIEKVFGRIHTQEHLYRHIHKIGQVRERFRKKVRVEYIYGLTYRTDDKEILIAGDRTDQLINVLNEDGSHKSFLKIIGCKICDGCFDIQWDKSQILFTSSVGNSKKLLVLDSNGIVKKSVNMPRDDQKKGGLYLAAGDDNTVFISSYNTDRLYKLHVDEDKLSMLVSGNECGPTYLCLTPTDELVVSNHSSSNIQIYSKNGELQWEYDGKEEGNALCEPNGVCCDKNGYIYVVDNKSCRIQVLHDKKWVGNIPIDFETKDVDDVPLVLTPDGDLIYGYGNNIVRISVWY